MSPADPTALAAPTAEEPTASEGWEAVSLAVRSVGGVVLALGDCDTGKSTFLRWLAREASARGRDVWLVDADVGQSSLGPPTVIAASRWGSPSPPSLAYVGSDTPRGHLLPCVVGAGRLVDRARRDGAEVILVNTTGWVSDGAAVALKLAKVDLLRPSHLVAFARGDELTPVLAPLRGLSTPRVWPLAPSPLVRARGSNARREDRERRWQRYLQGATERVLSLDDVGLHGATPESLVAMVPQRRVVGLFDRENECVGVGALVRADVATRTLTVLTPVPERVPVARAHLGASVVPG